MLLVYTGTGILYACVGIVLDYTRVYSPVSIVNIFQDAFAHAIDREYTYCTYNIIERKLLLLWPTVFLSRKMNEHITHLIYLRIMRFYNIIMFVTYYREACRRVYIYIEWFSERDHRLPLFFFNNTFRCSKSIKVIHSNDSFFSFLRYFFKNNLTDNFSENFDVLKVKFKRI